MAPVAHSVVNLPVEAVEAPMDIPSKVEVENAPYQVEVAKEPVKRLAERVVKLPVEGVEAPMDIPFNVVVAFSM